MTRKTATPTLASAMRILARQIQSPDGVANSAIAEAAERLDELHIINGEMLATTTPNAGGNANERSEGRVD